jgi:hypothetical protein
MRRLLVLGLALALAVSLSACGRKSSPKPPEGSEYPHVYPYTPFPGEQFPGGWGSGKSPQSQPDEQPGPEQRQPTSTPPLDHPGDSKATP